MEDLIYCSVCCQARKSSSSLMTNHPAFSEDAVINAYCDGCHNVQPHSVTPQTAVKRAMPEINRRMENIKRLQRQIETEK